MDNKMIPVELQSERDLEYMDMALEMGEEAIRANEIPVGCVFVNEQTNQVVARGRNRTNQGKNAILHAEFDAMRHILPPRSFCSAHSAPDPSQSPTDLDSEATKLNDLTLYVTVEPCIMCASALRQVGIKRVVYGCFNEKFGGTGGVRRINDDSKIGYSQPYEAVGGYRREEAILLLRRFYITENTTAPKPKDKSRRVLKTDFDEITHLQTS